MNFYSNKTPSNSNKKGHRKGRVHHQDKVAAIGSSMILLYKEEHKTAQDISSNEKG